ncbi:uncharacterized protein ALTATR162_LOCUS8352 [Alternaria atra]|uniref:Heterokaryon incompatibility domain-containing protein n=1 Tax=Alternaria atra TaxID=119953 RepID=A0A8J2IFX9_9PLEO|nr:uncharacterized protein ALTATR162_LOCUS8352 [Alternaria atra]CAG5177728.1 unnamed protein product [Alternaria atra]
MYSDTNTTDSDLPSLLERYKPVPQHAIDPACLSLAKQWLSTCLNGHQQCDKRFDTAGPSRLIDLRGDVIKLALAPEESTQGSYVALSHCWGGSQSLQTTLASLASFQERISPNDLPQTFLDAIYVTRALGFSHIWIDSLCIIQDDASDWEQQSSIMASIYSNADLVLAGVAAGSADEGFLRKPRQSCEGIVNLSVRGGESSFVYRVVPDSHDFIEEPLYKRGWTLQERLCARRFLAYGNWEMSWECKECSCCEYHGNNLDSDSISQQEGSFGARMETTSPQDFAQLWGTRVVYPYCRRSLTKATDTPVAISALAARFHSQFQGTYLAGLWKEDLCKALLWFSKPPGRPSSFFAPTWSWMSLQLPHEIDYDPTVTSNHVLEETLVFNVQTEVTPSTTNPYGPVSSGTIRLAGILISASLEAGRSPADPWEDAKMSTLRYNISSAISYIDTPIVRVDARLMNGTEESTTKRAARQEENPGGAYPVTLLPIFRYSWGVTGLLLGRSVTCVGAYERIGMFDYLSGSTFDSMRKDYEVCDVTLV